jgi:hypothetical protein
MKLNRFKAFATRWANIPDKISKIQESLGRIEARQLVETDIANINEAEFKVYSQWGEDGIIQHILKYVPIDNKVFIEFGVENYIESNTRFLLINNKWSGLILDGNKEHIEYIKKDMSVYWAHNLKAEYVFITKDNINDTIVKNGIPKDIGLLSIDIDGNDYWIWEAITEVKPRIVICEFNALFGPIDKVSIPYKDDFVRDTFHYSNIYYGASLAALEFLGKQKGYALVGINSTGNNAFFVSYEYSKNFKILTSAEAFRTPQFREAKDINGELSYINLQKQRELISDLQVINVQTKNLLQVKDLQF